MYLNYADFLKENPDLQIFLSQEIDKWKQARKGFFTASAIHKLFTKKYQPADNETATAYIHEKVAEILGADLPEVDTIATRWGNEHQTEAITYISTNSDLTLVENSLFIPKTDFTGCTPDAFTQNRDAIAQIKCPYNPANHVKYLKLQTMKDLKEYHPDHYLQIQFELYVTDLDDAFFITYDKRFDDRYKHKIIRVRRDDDIQKTMLKVVGNAIAQVQFILSVI